MKGRSLLWMSALLLLACTDEPSEAPSTDTRVEPPANPVFFQSGFENGVTVGENGQGKCSGDIEGSDDSESGDWREDLEQSPFDSAQVCFGEADDCALQGEPSCQRSVARVSDPADADNGVLHTWIQEPAENFGGKDADDVACSCEGGVDTLGNECETSLGDGYDNAGTRKARVQLTLDTPEGSVVPQLTYSVRIRLGEAFTAMSTELANAVNWMTIGEFWNQGVQNINMGDRARVTINLVKAEGTAPFYFGLKADYQPDGETGWLHLWETGGGEALVSDVQAPIGEWFTLRVHLVAGDASNGRVKIDFIDQTGVETPLFDVSDATIYPGTDRVGFTAIQPIKIYTSGDLMCWLQSLPTPLRLEAWWDDLVLSL